MKVLFLNAVYTEALAAMGVDISKMAKFDDFSVGLNYTDQHAINVETLALLKVYPLRDANFTPLYSAENSDFYPSPGELEDNPYLSEVLTVIPHLACIVIDADTAIFYVDSESVKTRQPVLEVFLNALADKLGVAVALQSDAYQYHRYL